MARTRSLPDLIENIYDAGLEPALWDDIVVGIRISSAPRLAD